MNWFIFNGISSEEFSGLVVNALPPITKPNKRMNNIVIAGRDGDINEFLGYEAYDKEITITLLKTDEIDEIMYWLNGEGDLITSLEPERIYKAEIINQIDYERLYKMKQATITFHVQPFKYELDEETVTQGQDELIENYIVNDGVYNGTLLETEDEGAGWEVITTFISVNPNQTYILAGTLTPENWAISVYFYDENQTLLEEREIIENNATFEFITPTGTKYIKFDGYTQNIDITTVSLKHITMKSVFVVNNVGNEKSKPIIKIKGSGSIETIVNNKLAFIYTFPENENEVYIDSEKQDAYLGNVLKNRNMNGEFPVLEAGKNIIYFNGLVESIEIYPKSRWL